MHGNEPVIPLSPARAAGRRRPRHAAESEPCAGASGEPDHRRGRRGQLLPRRAGRGLCPVRSVEHHGDHAAGRGASRRAGQIAPAPAQPVRGRQPWSRAGGATAACSAGSSSGSAGFGGFGRWAPRRGHHQQARRQRLPDRGVPDRRGHRRQPVIHHRQERGRLLPDLQRRREHRRRLRAGTGSAPSRPATPSRRRVWWRAARPGRRPSSTRPAWARSASTGVSPSASEPSPEGCRPTPWSRPQTRGRLQARSQETPRVEGEDDGMTEGTFRDWPLPASPPTEPPPAPPGMAGGPSGFPSPPPPLLPGDGKGTRPFAGKRTGRWSAVSPPSPWWPAASAPPSAWAWLERQVGLAGCDQRHRPVRRRRDHADPDRARRRPPPGSSAPRWPAPPST